jgi:uncharacterized protein (DUF1499 family)
MEKIFMNILKYITSALCAIIFLSGCTKSNFPKLDNLLNCQNYNNEDLICLSSSSKDKKFLIEPFKVYRGLNQDINILDNIILKKSSYKLTQVKENYRVYKTSSYYFRSETSLEVFINSTNDKIINFRLLCSKDFLKSCPNRSTIEEIRFFYIQNEH